MISFATKLFRIFNKCWMCQWVLDSPVMGPEVMCHMGNDFIKNEIPKNRVCKEHKHFMEIMLKGQVFMCREAK